jgi:hypothetical protein
MPGPWQTTRGNAPQCPRRPPSFGDRSRSRRRPIGRDRSPWERERASAPPCGSAIPAVCANPVRYRADPAGIPRERAGIDERIDPSDARTRDERERDRDPRSSRDVTERNPHRRREKLPPRRGPRRPLRSARLEFPRGAGRHPPRPRRPPEESACSVSKRLPGPSRTPAHRRHAFTEVQIGIKEALQVALELDARVRARIQPKEPKPSHRAARNEAIRLERSKRLLDPRQPQAKNASQLARVALAQGLQGKEALRPRTATEGAAGPSDPHRWSYDHH